MPTHEKRQKRMTIKEKEQEAEFERLRRGWSDVEGEAQDLRRQNEKGREEIRQLREEMTHIKQLAEYWRGYAQGSLDSLRIVEHKTDYRLSHEPKI